MHLRVKYNKRYSTFKRSVYLKLKGTVHFLNIFVSRGNHSQISNRNSPFVASSRAGPGGESSHAATCPNRRGCVNINQERQYMELQTFLQSQGVSLRKPNSICLKKQSLDISCPMLSPSKIFSLR